MIYALVEKAVEHKTTSLSLQTTLRIVYCCLKHYTDMYNTFMNFAELCFILLFGLKEQ